MKKKEYMEKRKIIDCFTFFNELDLLEKRLEYMSQYVDKFIISESPTTHSGNEKPFYFEQNADRFSKWNDKIIYIKTKPLGDGFWDREKYRHLIIDFSGGEHNEETWKKWEREGQQRFAIEEELKKFSDNDIILYSDLDEIPDFSKVNLETIDDDIYVCMQRTFRYSFDYMVDTTEFTAHGTLICSNKNAKENGLIYLRGNRWNYKQINECGWHMTKFGTDEHASEILSNYAHSGEHDYTEHIKNKTSWATGNPLIKTPQEIKDSIPIFFYKS
jgi:beta-1,4-mannosyl-glycoprotein beta-1,4-N-acetylglucosaminyltransferase